MIDIRHHHHQAGRRTGGRMLLSTREAEALYGVDGWVLASQIAKRALPIWRSLRVNMQRFGDSTFPYDIPARSAFAADSREREFLGYTGDIAEVAYIVC
eukprot:3938304-Rhodomonas_salina.1